MILCHVCQSQMRWWRIGSKFPHQIWNKLVNFLLTYFCRMTFWSNLPVRTMYILDFRLFQGRDYNCNYIVDGFYFFNWNSLFLVKESRKSGFAGGCLCKLTLNAKAITQGCKEKVDKATAIQPWHPQFSWMMG